MAGFVLNKVSVAWETVDANLAAMTFHTVDGQSRRVERPRLVSLTLTVDEAEALCAICGRVGGSPDTTRRRLVDRVDQKLSDLGVEVPFPSRDLLGELRFI